MPESGVVVSTGMVQATVPVVLDRHDFHPGYRPALQELFPLLQISHG
jgi:hypothetical protein